MYTRQVAIVEPWLSRVYVICTQSAVLHKTAGRVQITYILEAMVQLTWGVGKARNTE